MNREIIELREVISKLVPMLAGKGLVVTQRGSQAYVTTDPRTKRPTAVNIPMISEKASPEFIRAIQGYIDHEVAHVLITDWNYYAGGPTPAELRTAKVQQFMNTHNIVEDTMIEREIVRIFPGSRKNIADLRVMFIKDISLPAVLKTKHDPKQQFTYLCVPLMRALAGHVEFIEMMDTHKLWDNPFAAEVVAKLSEKSKKLLKTCSTTKETLEIARELHEIMYPPAPPAPPMKAEESEDKPEEEAGAGDGDGERDHKEEPHDEPEADEPESGSDEAGDPVGDDAGDAGEDEPEPDDGTADAGEDDVDAGDEPVDSEKDDTDGDDTAGDDGEGDIEPASDTDPADADDAGDEGEDDAEADEPSSSTPDFGDDADFDDLDRPDHSDDDGAGDEGDVFGDDDSADAEDGAGTTGTPADGIAGDGEDGEPVSGSGADEDGEPDPITDDEIVKIEGETDKGLSAGKKGSGDATKTDDGIGTGLFGDDPLDDDALKDKDMGAAIGEVITKEALMDLRFNDYTVFTRDWDKIEPLPVDPDDINPEWIPQMEDRVRQMIGRMQKDIERMLASQSHVIRTPGHRRGKLHTPSLYRVPGGDDRVFSQKQEHVSKDTTVTLLVDNSGSMSGRKQEIAMMAAYALSLTLDRVNIKHEVMGFTTHGGFYGLPPALQAAIDEDRRKSGINYNRTLPLYMPIFKGHDERIGATVKQRFARAIYEQDFLAGNIDGECLEYAAMRMMKRREKRKVMLVLSDGAPVEARNAPEHLRYMVNQLEEKWGIDCIGIGINDNSVKKFYPRHVVLHKVEELPGQVMQELKKILT